MENSWIIIVGIAIGCFLWEVLSSTVENNVLKDYNEWKRKQKELRTTK